MDYEEIYKSNKQEKLFGRYITLNNIEPILNDLKQKNQLSISGFSVLKNPIYSLTIGRGNIKILIWSQMHGNESTTTKAVFDFINFLNSNENITSNFTFCIIPILNPDGAEAYTRENANLIDLNRDFKNLSQPESLKLMQIYKDFNPDYCYNMHDQRTIYGVENSGNPATISFLAPSFNENRDFNTNRKLAASIIVAINNVLQKYIPNQIGRFDDTYNENCAGDSFQALGKPTILFEAGHYQNDYEREFTRKYIFFSLIASIEYIMNIDKSIYYDDEIDKYLAIPQNKVCFFDLIYTNVNLITKNSNQTINIALNYEESLNNGVFNKDLVITQIQNLNNYFGHLVIDATDLIFESDIDIKNQLNLKANFRIGNNLIINGKLTVL
jgi:Zinc carboxypeptidase